jgi:hypothetical protein
MADELNALKAKLLSTANSNDLGALERILATIKLISETEKIEAENVKVKSDMSRGEFEAHNLARQARLESTRLWLPITVPAASAVFLAALTIVFQIFQLSKTTQLQQTIAEHASRVQQDAAWDAQWRSAIQTLADAKTPDATVAGVAFLAVFSQSERYRESAHKLALQYLTRVQGTSAFKTLCGVVFGNIRWSDLEDMAPINRSLGDRYGVLFNELKNPKAKDRSSLEAEEDIVQQNILFLNSKIVAALRNRPPGEPANLESLSLFQTNLKGVDFRGSNIRYVGFGNSDVTDADFRDVKAFDDSNWSYVTWWKVKAISKPLLTDLKARFPFGEPKSDYWAVPTSVEDYNSNIIRLENQITRPSAP